MKTNNTDSILSRCFDYFLRLKRAREASISVPNKMLDVVSVSPVLGIGKVVVFVTLDFACFVACFVAVFVA